jgi:hypothetical protein
MATSRLSPRTRRWTSWIFASYLIVAAFQSWPLVLHLGDRVTGSMDGDAGVYIWNPWVFAHELRAGHWPFTTDTILPFEGPTDLSLHNYTVFNDLVALPFLPSLGLVATFNAIYLLNIALAGFGMFVLARRVTGRTAEAWIAGFLFACSPFLVERGGGHFSLAAAAPLPFFAYWLDRAWTNGRLRDGAMCGAMLAWGYFSDPYFGIYCAALLALFVACQVFRVDATRRAASPRAARLAVDVLLVLVAAAVAGIHWLAGGDLRLGGVHLEMHTLYTPVLALTLLVVVRAWLAVRLTVTRRPVEGLARRARAGAAAVAAAVMLLSPALYTLAARAVAGRMVTAPVRWRSSAPGVDLVDFVLPNPNHPLAPHAIRAFLEAQPGHAGENVASLPLVALAVIVIAWRVARFRPDRTWLVVTAAFASVTVGPFLRIGGVETLIPTPWTFLRYVPVLGEARMPSRFSVMVLLGVTVMFASALAALGRHAPERRRRMLAVVGALVVFELLALPRPLFSAAVPSVYRTIAADPRDVRVLDLPFGVRDGLVTYGAFSPASQFYQAVHGKPIIGGYLSRISEAKLDYYRGNPLLRALMDLSEGQPVGPAERESAVAAAPAFLAASHLGYVVIDDARTSADLRALAIEALGLTPVDRGDGRVLYVPASTPAPPQSSGALSGSPASSGRTAGLPGGAPQPPGRDRPAGRRRSG